MSEDCANLQETSGTCATSPRVWTVHWQSLSEGDTEAGLIAETPVQGAHVERFDSDHSPCSGDTTIKQGLPGCHR